MSIGLEGAAGRSASEKLLRNLVAHDLATNGLSGSPHEITHGLALHAEHLVDEPRLIGQPIARRRPLPCPVDLGRQGCRDRRLLLRRREHDHVAATSIT